jgi:hypothetical protein
MASFSQGAIVVSWGSTIPGREAKMLDVLSNVLAYTCRLEKAGRIDEARVYTSTTGPNRDTLMLFGDVDELARLLVDDEFEDQLQDGMLVVQDLNVALWAGGKAESVAHGMRRHAEKLREHALV